MFYGRTDSKKRSVGRAYFLFFNNIFLHFLPKLPEKIMIFSCSLRSKFFIQIFVQKMADFTLLGSKKKIFEQMEKKRSVGPVKHGFLFSWPKLFLHTDFTADEDDILDGINLWQVLTNVVTNVFKNLVMLWEIEDLTILVLIKNIYSINSSFFLILCLYTRYADNTVNDKTFVLWAWIYILTSNLNWRCLLSIYFNFLIN